MGKIYLQTAKLIFLCGLLTVTLVTIPKSAKADLDPILNPGNGSCFINNPLGENMKVSQYDDPRGGGARSHRGVDIFADMCTPAPHQDGCSIVPAPSGSPLWDHGSKGYGLWIKYNCGNGVEVRYTHMNSFENGIGKVGHSGNARGTPPHIHYEVIVHLNGKGHKVDPQCVWGAHPNRERCCIGVSNCGDLGSQRTNMCDQSNRQKLWDNAAARGKIRDHATKHGPPPPGQPPSSFREGHRVDIKDCVPIIDPNKPPHGPIDDDPGNEVDPPPEWDPIPGDPTPDPPPPPTTPGKPGDDPELVPKTPTEVEKYSGCATDTWTAMVNQSVMETRRQDILNKRFIVKTKTILDYSCFDFPFGDKNNFVKRTAEKTGPIFSETAFWKNKKVPTPYPDENLFVKRELGSKSLDNALASVVGITAVSYRNGGFEHPYLSGTVPVSVDPSGSNCDVMNKLWAAAKCKHFDGVDVFYTFKELTTKEPREFPPNYKCNGG